MKKIISIILLVFVLAISLTSCDVLLDTVTGLIDPNKQEYNNALKLIEEKKYEEAYDALKKLEGYEPAEKELENFYSVPVYFDTTVNYVSYLVYDIEYNEKELISTYTIISSGQKLVMEFSYDSNNNATNCIIKDGLGNTTNTVEQTFDSKNQMTSSVAKDASGKVTESITYTYDEKGNLKNIVSTNGSGTKTTTGYTYDSDGNVTKEVVASGLSVVTTDYTYNDDGKITTKVMKAMYGSVEAKFENYTYVYDEEGKLEKVTIRTSSGTTIRTYTYNDQNQCTKLVISSSIGNETIYYTYDKYGNVVEMTENINYNTISIEVEWKLIYFKGELPQQTQDIMKDIGDAFLLK